jgi:hypothetical protein
VFQLDVSPSFFSSSSLDPANQLAAIVNDRDWTQETISPLSDIFLGLSHEITLHAYIWVHYLLLVFEKIKGFSGIIATEKIWRET